MVKPPLLGWSAGLPCTFVLPALVPDGASLTLWFAAFAGMLKGLTVGAITGVVLLWLMRYPCGHPSDSAAMYNRPGRLTRHLK